MAQTYLPFAAMTMRLSTCPICEIITLFQLKSISIIIIVAKKTVLAEIVTTHLDQSWAEILTTHLDQSWTHHYFCSGLAILYKKNNIECTNWSDV
jgi:hypothetical protein